MPKFTPKFLVMNMKINEIVSLKLSSLEFNQEEWKPNACRIQHLPTWTSWKNKNFNWKKMKFSVRWWLTLHIKSQELELMVLMQRRQLPGDWRPGRFSRASLSIHTQLLRVLFTAGQYPQILMMGSLRGLEKWQKCHSPLVLWILCFCFYPEKNSIRFL